MLGLGGEGHGDADDVGLSEQCCQLASLGAEFRFQLGLWRCIGIEDTHAETQGAAPGDGGADAPEANHAQGLAMYVVTEVLGADSRCPVTALDQLGQFYGASGGGQDQQKAGVGGGLGEYVRGVAQQDPTTSELCDGVVVVAYGDGRDGLQIRGRVE